VKTVKSLEELDKYRFKVMKKDKRFKKWISWHFY
jgi:hypothetical protein